MTSSNKDLKRIAQWISKDDAEAFHRTVAKCRIAGTCDWFLEQRLVADWLEGHVEKLWVVGTGVFVLGSVPRCDDLNCLQRQQGKRHWRESEP